MALRTKVVKKNLDVYAIDLTGRLDGTTAADCEADIAPIFSSSPSAVLINLAGMDYISSAGVRLLLKIKKHVKAHGGTFAVARAQPPVAKVLDMAEILLKTEVFDSEKSADIFLDAIQRQESMKHSDMPDE